MPPRRDLADRFARGPASKKRRPNVRPNVPVPGVAPAPSVTETDGAAPRGVAAPPPSRPVSTFAARRAANVSNANRPRYSPLTTDYNAVRRDLRRIAMLAGGIGIFMVVLSFFVR